MKDRRKQRLCKKADKIAIFSFECAQIFLDRYYLNKFYDEWTRREMKREGVLKCHS